jgi:hypothetical protein
MFKVNKVLKAYKEELKIATKMALKELIRNHSDELEEYSNKYNCINPRKFCKKALGSAYTVGDMYALVDWVKGALDEIKLGDLLFEIEEGSEED